MINLCLSGINIYNFRMMAIHQRPNNLCLQQRIIQVISIHSNATNILDRVDCIVLHSKLYTITLYVCKTNVLTFIKNNQIHDGNLTKIIHYSKTVINFMNISNRYNKMY